MKAAERKSSRPEAWLSAGAKVPIRLTAKQEAYCKRAQDVRRFCYNWPSPPTGSTAPTGCHGHPGRTSTWPSTPAKGRLLLRNRSRRPRRRGRLHGLRKSRRKLAQPATESPPTRVHKRKLAGLGSFRAGSGVAQIKYNGKRRVRLPVIGSIKLNCTLPKGIYHEAHIRRQNADGTSASSCGSHSHRCRKTTTAPPEPSTPASTPAPPTPTARYTRTQRPTTPWNGSSDAGSGPSPQNQRVPWMVGGPAAHRQMPPPHRWPPAQTPSNQMTNTLTKKYNVLVIEDLNVAGMMAGPTPKAQADAAMGRNTEKAGIQSALAPSRPCIRPPAVPQQQAMQLLPVPQRETQAGKVLDLPGLRNPARTKHQRRIQPEKSAAPRQGGRCSATGRLWASASSAGGTGPDDRRTAPQSLRGRQR